VGLTPQALARLAVPEAAALPAAAEPLAAWLAAVPEDAVRQGLERAASPLDALVALARLRDVAPLPSDASTVEAALRMVGGSPALATALVAEGADWPRVVERVLRKPPRDAPSHVAALHGAACSGELSRSELLARLRRYRRRELARIGGRDLLGLARVEETMREITALADALLIVAVEATRGRLAREWGADPGVGFVVLGMGKLGGEELNYSSDIDLVYVYAHEGEHAGERSVREFCCRLAEEVTRAIGEVTPEGFCFRVDLRLRPGGDQGPIASSLAGAVSYYEAWGQTWERAVWLKARPIAGDLAVGAQLLAELEPFVYRRYLDFGTLDDLKAMKRRVDASLRATAAERDVKLGRGGIRSVEFWVQAHQLVHGGKDPRLRERSTLGALARLAASGYVPTAEAERLAAAYRFLRDVEHKLQIVRERQTQLLPADAEELERLARRLGFLGPDGTQEFRDALAVHTAVVDGAFSALFLAAEAERRRDEQPELARLVDELDHEEQAMWRLAQLGFRDLETALENLRLLREGPPHAPASPRRRAAMSALAPQLIAEVVRSAAPDRALGHLATFVATIGAHTSYLHLLLENPGVLRLLVRLFAASEFLSRFFLRHPEVLDSLVRADLVRVSRTADDLRAELRERLAAAPDTETELDTLRRFRHEEFLRIGVHDIEGELSPMAVAAQLSLLAEVVLDEAVALARRWAVQRLGLDDAPATAEFAVLAMGKLGGRELAYHSDLDLIFVYDASDLAWWSGRVAPHELFTRVAQRTISLLQTATREGVAYRIDTRLRPSGNQGPLVTSLAAFESYHATRAALWERQALVKARPVVGPPALCARLEAVVTRAVYGRGLDADEVAELERMRERIAAERGGGGAGRLNIKTDWGGLVDVEFAVQLLQLQHGHAVPALRVQGTREALKAIEAEGLLAREDVEHLRAGYDFLRALESRLRIERDQPVEALPDDDAVLASLARGLGYTGDDAAVATALRQDHRRHREAIRAVWARVLAAAAR